MSKSNTAVKSAPATPAKKAPRAKDAKKPKPVKSAKKPAPAKAAPEAKPTGLRLVGASPKALRLIAESGAIFEAVHALRPLVKTSLLPGSNTEFVVISATAGGKVELRATDRQTSARVICSQVTIEEPGRVAAPLAVLHDALSHAKSSPTVVLREESKDGLSVSTDGSRVDLRCLSIDEAPAFPELKPKHRVTIAAAALAAAIREVKYAVGAETSRYAISGILFAHDGKSCSFVATDGRRLAVVRKVSGGDKVSAILPIAAARIIERYARDGEGDVVLAFDEKLTAVAVDAGSWQVHASLIEGNFPPYLDVIPKAEDAKASARVKPADLVEAVRHAAVVREPDRAVKVEFTAQGLRVQADGEPGTSNVQTCPIAEFKGEPLQVGFNPDFLCDIGKAIEGDELNVALFAPGKPVLAWIGSSIHVLMPVNLQ